MRGPAKLAALALAAALGGCYHGSARAVSPAALRAADGWEVVRGVVSLRQSSSRDCGAAALAMMLGRWGVTSSSSAELLKILPFDPQHGIAAGALRDLARRRGLQAYLIKGELDDLTREVAHDRPVLVGLVQNYGDKALSHYEVVIGINASARRILTLDPARGPREDGFDGFAVEWTRAGRLAIVVDAFPKPAG